MFYELTKKEKGPMFDNLMGMDTVALLKERMGYVESTKHCDRCRSFTPIENICNISNMAEIPVRPGGSCAYYVRNEKLAPDPDEIIYQWRNTDTANGELNNCNKEWYDGADSVGNIEVRIKS